MCSCDKFISDSTKQEIAVPFSSWKPNGSTEHKKEIEARTRMARAIYCFATTSTAGKPKSLSNKRHQQEVEEPTCKWQTTEHQLGTFGLLRERDKTMWNVCTWIGQLPPCFQRVMQLCYVLLRWGEVSGWTLRCIIQHFLTLHRCLSSFCFPWYAIECPCTCALVYIYCWPPSINLLRAILLNEIYCHPKIIHGQAIFFSRIFSWAVLNRLHGHFIFICRFHWSIHCKICIYSNIHVCHRKRHW